MKLHTIISFTFDIYVLAEMKRLKARIKKLLSCLEPHSNTSIVPAIDVQEEYAHAFRTESYNQFWVRILALNHPEATTHKPVESTTAARLQSYRLFVEHLLDPDQATVSQILDSTKARPIYHSLLYDYFAKTADASLLCSGLLKHVEQTRIRYRTLKKSLDYLKVGPIPVQKLPDVLTRLTEFTKSFSPFVISASSSTRFGNVQADCSELLKQLESNRKQAQAKLRLINGIRCGSAVFLVMLTASVVIVVALHAFATLVAAPSLVATTLELASLRRLAKGSSQLDAAAKGTYILIRDLDTVSRLVARLNDELEHMCEMVGFWLERRDDRLQSCEEVSRQMMKNDLSFSQQLDELEEHLYLCFMTINRARNLVLKKIMDPGQVTREPNTVLV